MLEHAWANGVCNKSYSMVNIQLTVNVCMSVCHVMSCLITYMMIYEAGLKSSAEDSWRAGDTSERAMLSPSPSRSRSGFNFPSIINMPLFNSIWAPAPSPNSESRCSTNFSAIKGPNCPNTIDHELEFPIWLPVLTRLLSMDTTFPFPFFWLWLWLWPLWSCCCPCSGPTLRPRPRPLPLPLPLDVGAALAVAVPVGFGGQFAGKSSSWPSHWIESYTEIAVYWFTAVYCLLFTVYYIIWIYVISLWHVSVRVTVSVSKPGPEVHFT